MSLSDDERALMLDLIAAGKRTSEIAQAVGCSPSTVKVYRRRVAGKVIVPYFRRDKPQTVEIKEVDPYRCKCGYTVVLVPCVICEAIAEWKPAKCNGSTGDLSFAPEIADEVAKLRAANLERKAQTPGPDILRFRMPRVYTSPRTTHGRMGR